MGCMLTCPPEKPTATTPSSLGLDRNLGVIVEGDVMFGALWRVLQLLWLNQSRNLRTISYYDKWTADMSGHMR